jgi:hypothetical protein
VITELENSLANQNEVCRFRPPRRAPSISCLTDLSGSRCVEFFDQALLAITTPPPAPETLYFVDDSALNVKGANSLGWGNCVLFDEMKDEAGKLGGLEKVAQGEDVKAKVTVVHDMQGE